MCASKPVKQPPYFHSLLPSLMSIYCATNEDKRWTSVYILCIIFTQWIFFQTTWPNYIEYEMNRTRSGCEVLPFSKRKLSVFKCKRSDVEKPYNVDNRIQIEIEVNPIEKVSNGCPTRFRC